MPRLDDTIAAISSAVGPAARMIVRASGPSAAEIITTLCPGFSSPACLTTLKLNALRFPAWVYHFPIGRSYTGDELIELHIPGNPLLARLVLSEMIARGARPAEAGEFTARAYFNQRIDLSQAEGVAAVVSAANQAELDAARRLMAGELSRRLRPMMDELAQTLALIEAEIDFSDQDVRFLAADVLASRLANIETDLTRLLQNSPRLWRLAHEPRIALAGRPNAGKSTLLNALSNSARAIVSPAGGTTRDTLSAKVCLPRGLVCVVDMAGLEETSRTEIEEKMRRRALSELQQADVIVLLRDAADARPVLDLPRTPDLVVQTKIDATMPSSSDVLSISVHTGQGMDQLRQSLDVFAFGSSRSELALTARHTSALESALQSVARARQCAAAELMAAELRGALDALGQILGEVTPDEILGRVFATFCIGK